MREEVNMSKLIDKLVNVAGGWESFLYATLKDVCKKVRQHGFTGEGEEAIDEANEVLDAYTNKHNIAQPNNVPSTNVRKDTKEVSKVVNAVKPLIQSQESDSELKSEISKPAKADRASVHVDNSAGASQGMLPIPANHVIVNKELIAVTTIGGLELGRGSKDGQIRGQGVSGHISNSGSYRLVFIDVDLGNAFIDYLVQQVK